MHVFIQYVIIFWNVLFGSIVANIQVGRFDVENTMKIYFSHGHTLYNSVSFFKYRNGMLDILKVMLFDETINAFVNSYKHKRMSYL